MNSKATQLRRLVAAIALGAGLVSAGAAASAQTTAQAAVTTGNATNVSISTVDAKAKRQIDLEQENADARRVEFLHLGTSL
jgi:anti-sigma28 factor (negative regulator of flagellin synthesis)